MELYDVKLVSWNFDCWCLGLLTVVGQSNQDQQDNKQRGELFQVITSFRIITVRRT